MEKNILNEINRNREIMGLGQLLREAASADPDKVKIWMNSDGKDSSSSITKLITTFVKNGYIETTINGMNIWAALNQAFYNMTGMDIVDETGQGTTAAFGKGQFGNVQQKVKRGSGERYNRPLIMIGGKKLRVNSTELGLSGDNEIGVTELIDEVNTFNVKNAGSEQIIFPEKMARYKKNGNANSLISSKREDYLYLWSIKKSKSVRNVTKGETIPGDVTAGEVLNLSLGDNYDDLKINITDDSKVSEANGKIAGHIKKGGTVDKIVILSTASNTGLKTDDASKASFAKMMTDAGFPEYANVSPTAGGEGDFTIDEVKTTDQALAVARGKLLAKKLAIQQEDKIEFKFSVRGTDKIVDVSVQGTSPDVQGDDIEVAGSIDDKIETSERGASEQVYPYITYIRIKGRGFFDKIGDGLGTTSAMKRKKKA